MSSTASDSGNHKLRNEPVPRQPRANKFVWVALAYSAVMSAVAWLTPIWQNSTSVDSLFGNNLLAPIFLFLALMVVGLLLDLVALGLTFALVPKTQRKPRIIMCAIAIFLLVAPVVVDSIYSAVIVSGA
jgi:hypothetical protein